MTLSQNPEKLLVRLDITPAPALALFPRADVVASRHEIEKILQAKFFGLKLDAFVASGQGTAAAGTVLILTDTPAATLPALQDIFGDFPAPAHEVNLLPYVHLAWRDAADNLWRVAHPLTTRPGWSLFSSPEEINALIAKGREIHLAELLK